MGYGSWNGVDGDSPAHPDAYCKVQLGWISPTTPTAYQASASLPAVEETQTAYKLWTSGAAGSEYFLLENRQLLGFDAALPGRGLLLYHVDEAASQNNDWHPKVMVEQADGLWHLQSKTNYGDASDTFPGNGNKRAVNASTTPNTRSYSGTDTQVKIKNISNTSSSMTADIIVDANVHEILVGDGYPTLSDLNGDGDTDDYGEFGDGIIGWGDVTLAFDTWANPGSAPASNSARFCALDSYTSAAGDGRLSWADVVTTFDLWANPDQPRVWRFFSAAAPLAGK
jgi:hypothetical protein